MNYVRLGRTGLKVSEYCMGGDNFGGQMDEAESLNVLSAAFDGGVTFIDTANVYEEGRSETFIGKFLQGRRYDVILASKGNGRLSWGPNGRQVSRKYAMDAIDDSLRRLNTDYIDLYQIHDFPLDVPIDEFVLVYSDIVQSGKARYIGVCNFAAFQVVEALWQADKLGARLFNCYQGRYNLLSRDPEREIFPVCEEYGLGVMAFSPRAGGLLLGQDLHFEAEPGSRFSPDFRHFESFRRTYWTEANFDVVEKIITIAKKYGVSMNALTSRWVISNPAVTACIMGAHTVEHVRSNLEAWHEDVPQEAIDEATVASEAVRTPYADVTSTYNQDQISAKR